MSDDAAELITKCLVASASQHHVTPEWVDRMLKETESRIELGQARVISGGRVFVPVSPQVLNELLWAWKKTKNREGK